MRQIYNLLPAAKKISAFWAVSLLIATASPASAGALGNGSGAAANDQFCSGLDTKQAAVNDKLVSLKSKLTANWKNQDDRFATNKQKVDDKVASIRKNIDQQRKQNFVALESKAKNADQKTAVTAYQSAINRAVSIRRVTVDNARASFRSSAREAIATRRATMTGQADKLRIDNDGAFTVAQASCSTSSAKPTAIRATLAASLKASRQSFADARKGDNTIKDQLQSFVQTRKDAVKTANQTFKTSQTAAVAALKAALAKN